MLLIWPACANCMESGGRECEWPFSFLDRTRISKGPLTHSRVPSPGYSSEQRNKLQRERRKEADIPDTWMGIKVLRLMYVNGEGISRVNYSVHPKKDKPSPLVDLLLFH